MNRSFGGSRLGSRIEIPRGTTALGRDPEQGTSLQKEALFTGDFILLLVSGLMLTTGIGVFYLFPLYVLELGGSRADIGILMGAMSLSAVGARPWISAMVDRMGRKGSLAAGALLLVLVGAAHFFSRGAIDELFPFLILLRMLFGAGMALGIIASLTLAADLAAGPRLNEGVGIFGAMPMLGIAVGPVLGEAVVHRWGFDGVYLLAMLFFVCCCLFLIPLKDRFRAPAGKPGSGFWTALRIPLVSRMAVVCLCFGVAFAAHAGFVAPFAEAGGLSVSAYFGCYSAAAVLSRLFGSRLADRLGETRIIPVSLVVAGIGFLCLVKVTSTPALMGSGFLSGLGQGFLFPSLIALTLRPVSVEERGKVTGILTGGFDAGMFAGSLIMGQLGEHFGFPMIFVTAVASLCLGLGAFLRSKRKLGI